MPRAASASDNVHLDADFPGGNIRILGVEGDTFHLAPDHRDSTSRWFYWAFRVRNAGGRMLRFFFHDVPTEPLSLRGPAVSLDSGAIWRWMSRDIAEPPTGTPQGFYYVFNPDIAEYRFSVAMPYTLADLQRMLAEPAVASAARLGTLCRTRQGRQVPTVRIGAGETASAGVLVTARHHACECMASWVLDGLLAAAAEGQAFARAGLDLLAVPLVDLDGVEAGDQGKNRAPHDHNRDYAGQGIYPEPAALRQLAPQWLAGRPLVALDLHCPWLLNTANYLVGSAERAVWQRQQAFAAVLERLAGDVFGFRADGCLPWGTGWNQPGKVTGTFSGWAGTLGERVMAATLEIPWALAGGRDVTQRSARRFGQALADALIAYATTARGP